jgi:hypothetical protein
MHAAVHPQTKTDSPKFKLEFACPELKISEIRRTTLTFVVTSCILLAFLSKKLLCAGCFEGCSLINVPWLRSVYAASYLETSAVE